MEPLDRKATYLLVTNGAAESNKFGEPIQAVEYHSVNAGNNGTAFPLLRDCQLFIIPVDVYIRVSHNSDMRYLLLALAIIPSASADSHNRLYFAPRLVETLLPIPEIIIEDPRQVKCLAVTVYGEARSEEVAGMLAVAHVIKNRAQSRSVCKVVLYPMQFSIFNNNAALRAAALSPVLEPVQKNSIDAASWAESVRIAAAVLRGATVDPTQGATHYIADKVMQIKGYKYPKWSKQFAQTTVIGNHRFFKDNNNL